RLLNFVRKGEIRYVCLHCSSNATLYGVIASWLPITLLRESTISYVEVTNTQDLYISGTVCAAL
ncbi:MAG TPA: hypothetical protein VFU49_07680, partial [Ktedonobacteraceae bacterium]|nr:hypothetical protein [Ktedonobacteraceae bacterium]